MSFKENYSIENDFSFPKTFKELHENYDEKSKFGYGIYVIFKNKNFSHSINKSIIADNNVKIDFEAANIKLSKSDLLLIALPQKMYSTKYDVENEIFQLYQTGLKFPKRSFFGKLLFVLENFESLNVSYKKLDIMTARNEYSKLIKEYRKLFDYLPFANLSDRLPRLPYPY